MLPSLLTRIHKSSKDGQQYITLTDFYNFLKENCPDGCTVEVDRCNLEISVQALDTGYYVNNVEQNVDGKDQILNEVYLTTFTMFKLVFHLSEEVDLCKRIAHEIVNNVLTKAGYESAVKVEEGRTAEQAKEGDTNTIVGEVITTDTTTTDVDLNKVKTETETEEEEDIGAISNEEDIFGDITSEEEEKKEKKRIRGKGKVKYKKKLRKRKPFKIGSSMTEKTKAKMNLEKNIKCENCDQMFFSMRGLYNHRTKVHNIKVDFSCHQCGKKFKDNYKLNRHKKVHTRTRNHICEICGKSFSDSYKLNRHREQHATERNFKCSKCDKSFTTRRYVQKHELTHSAEKPFQCSTCGEFYKDKRSFQLHMARHGGYEVPAPYKCVECDRVFRNATDLDNHAAMRHRGEKRNICHICGKNFGLRGHVKGHLRTVHKIGITSTTKIYKCPYCEKTFMYATSYEAHVSTHTGIKAHKCIICLRNFSTMGNLGAHVKSVHHLPFSKKLYQESLKVVQSEQQQQQQQQNPDAASAAEGVIPLPDEPTLAPPPPASGTSLQSPPGASPTGNAPLVLYDKKALLEHYQKKVYQEPSPSSSNLATTDNRTSNSQENNSNSQDMNRPSSGVQSPQMLVAGAPVTSPGGNSGQDIRTAAPPSTTSGIQTQSVPAGMAHNMPDITRYHDMFVHPQQMMAPPELSYTTGNLPLPLYRPPTGPLHGSPM